METLLVALVMLIGLAGVVVPLLPGTALVLAAGVAWAAFVVDEGTGRWVVVGVMALLFVLGLVLKYALPGRHLAGALPRSTLLAGAAGAAIGFFVLPVLGLVVGGVVGIYAAESRRAADARTAWRSTVQVLRAVGLGILAELTAAVLMIGTWLAGVVLV